MADLQTFERCCSIETQLICIQPKLQELFYDITKIHLIWTVYSNSGYIRHNGPGNLLLYCDDNVVNGSIMFTFMDKQLSPTM